MHRDRIYQLLRDPLGRMHRVRENRDFPAAAQLMKYSRHSLDKIASMEAYRLDFFPGNAQPGAKGLDARYVRDYEQPLFPN